jgi:predicted permease
MDAVLLRSLPYGDVEQLVYLYTPSVQLLRMKVPAEVFNPSFADFEDLKKQSTSFSSMTVFRMSSFNFSGGDQLEKLGVARVDAAFFTTLQTQPELGRIFDAKDEKPGNAHVVLISHALWKSVYESKSSVLGQMVRLDGAEYKVVGVMPAGFEYPLSSDLPNVFGSVDRTQLWVPAALTSQQMTCRERCGAFAIGRLKPGTTLIQAQTELSTIMTRLDLLHSPSLNDFTAIVRPLREVALGEVKPLMFLLLGAVGLVLLIACGNAANLLLARAANRTQELGVRAALGARRGRLIRQMLTESVLLVVAAGFVGVALAWLLLRLLLQLNPGDIPRLENAGLDCRVLGFLIGVTALTSLLFGVLPSMITTDINFAEFLKRPGTGRSGR